MKTFFTPAFRLVTRLSVMGNVLIVIALVSIAQLIALAAPDQLVFVLVVFAVGIYLLMGLTLANKFGMIRLANTLERLASGDLSVRIKPPSGTLSQKAEIGRIWSAMVQMGTNLVGIVDQVRASADHIGNGAHEIASGYGDLSQRTEEQASTLEETAASMEQLSATVKQNADHCRQASARAEENGTRAEEAGESMRRVSDTMARIESGSRKMSEIIGLIEGIAFQTNILALNAAVEAARAGEHGRGFSVVATEVRELAQRSARAADGIKTLIQVSADDVSAGVDLVTQAQDTVDRAVSGIREVRGLIDSVARASEEQNAGVVEIGRALSQLESVTQRNAALVEEGAATSAAFEQEATRLVNMVGTFKVDRMQDRDAAVTLVKRVLARLRGGKPEQVFRDVDNPNGPFIDGELYAFIWDVHGIMHASPASQHLIGHDMHEAVDADGHKYAREIFETALAKGKGWCDYRLRNPAKQNRIEPKSAYFERDGEFIVGCGIYRPEAQQRTSAGKSPYADGRLLDRRSPDSPMRRARTALEN